MCLIKRLHPEPFQFNEFKLLSPKMQWLVIQNGHYNFNGATEAQIMDLIKQSHPEQLKFHELITLPSPEMQSPEIQLLIVQHKHCDFVDAHESRILLLLKHNPRCMQAYIDQREKYIFPEFIGLPPEVQSIVVHHKGIDWELVPWEDIAYEFRNGDGSFSLQDCVIGKHQDKFRLDEFLHLSHEIKLCVIENKHYDFNGKSESEILVALQDDDECLQMYIAQRGKLYSFAEFKVLTREAQLIAIRHELIDLTSVNWDGVATHGNDDESFAAEWVQHCVIGKHQDKFCLDELSSDLPDKVKSWIIQNGHYDFKCGNYNFDDATKAKIMDLIKILHPEPFGLPELLGLKSLKMRWFVIQSGHCNLTKKVIMALIKKLHPEPLGLPELLSLKSLEMRWLIIQNGYCNLNEEVIVDLIKQLHPELLKLHEFDLLSPEMQLLVVQNKHYDFNGKTDSEILVALQNNPDCIRAYRELPYEFITLSPAAQLVALAINHISLNESEILVALGDNPESMRAYIARRGKFSFAEFKVLTREAQSIAIRHNLIDLTSVTWDDVATYRKDDESFAAEWLRYCVIGKHQDQFILDELSSLPNEIKLYVIRHGHYNFDGKTPIQIANVFQNNPECMQAYIQQRALYSFDEFRTLPPEIQVFVIQNRRYNFVGKPPEQIADDLRHNPECMQVYVDQNGKYSLDQCRNLSPESLLFVVEHRYYNFGDASERDIANVLIHSPGSMRLYMDRRAQYPFEEFITLPPEAQLIALDKGRVILGDVTWFDIRDRIEDQNVIDQCKERTRRKLPTWAIALLCMLTATSVAAIVVAALIKTAVILFAMANGWFLPLGIGIACTIGILTTVGWKSHVEFHAACLFVSIFSCRRPNQELNQELNQEANREVNHEHN